MQILSQETIGYRKDEQGDIVQSVVQCEVAFEDGSVDTCYRLHHFHNPAQDDFTESCDVDIPDWEYAIKQAKERS